MTAGERRATRAVLLAGSLAPGGRLPPAGTLRISARPAGARLAHSLAAAAGRRAVVVGVDEPAHAELATGGRADLRARAPAAVRYDVRVLRALEPGARVEVGSLASLMPSMSWVSDPGGMVAVLDGGPTRPGPAAPAAPRPAPVAPAAPRPGPGARGRVVLKVRRLPKRPVGVRGSLRTVALDEPRLRGVPLVDGDEVLDASGGRWFVARGALWSHRLVSATRADVLVQGRTVRPARAGPGTLRGDPARPGDAVELTLTTPRGAPSAVLYGVLRQGAAGTWAARTEVDRSVVSDPRSTCFGPRAAATAAECVAAGGVWDRPCAVDTECPFHDGRSGRGGCVDGTCEMPLGVGNRSFRTPDPATPALCDAGRPEPWCDAARDPVWRAIMP